MPIGPARMPLMDHLGELRRRLVIIVVCFLISVCVLYAMTPQFIEFLTYPIKDLIPNDGQLYVTGVFEGFSLKFRVAGFASLITCSPIIFWEILAFFLPALKPNERKFVIPTFFAAVALFVLGMVFCYAFCLQAAFQFLMGESASFGTLLPSSTDYVHYVILFEIAFGIAFELPLVVFYLIIFDIVPYKKLRQNWRYIYVALLILSAVVTPDGSPVTLGILFAALLALYEASLAVARIVLNKKIKKQKEREAEEAAEEAAEEGEED